MGPSLTVCASIFQVASCFFWRTGPNGRQMRFDSICVLPLNVLNEKIFYILWFWYLVLMAVSVGSIFYRFGIVIPCPNVRR